MIVVLSFAGTVSQAQVTLRVKAASGTNLAAGASWTGGTLPISSTGAQWTSTSLGGDLTLGSNQTWGLMDVQGATANLNMTGSQLTIASATYTGPTSSVGINLPSAAGVDITFGNNLVIGGGQLWRVYSGRTLTVNGVVSSSIATNSTSFTMIAQGGGTLVLNGANTFLTSTSGSWMRIDGGTTVRVNAVANGGVASPLGQGSATASQLRINGGTIDYVGTGHSTNRLFALTANSTITSNGTGALTYTGTGNITYTDTTNVASSGRILTLGGTNAADNSFRPNLVDGTTASGLTKTGSGLWIVSGTNTFTGSTTVSAGTLVVPTTASLPGWNTAGRWSVASGAALGVGNSFTDANITSLLATGNFLSGASLGFSTALGNRTFSESLADTAAGPLGLVKTQANTLTLSGVNTFTGNTQIAGGTLAIMTTSALPGWDTAGRFSVVAGAMLSVGDAITGTQIADLTATGNFATGSFLGIDTASGNRTLAAPVAGAGGLRKAGANTLELAAANSYAGATEISGGTVALSGAGVLAATTAVSLTGAGTTLSISAADGDRTISSLTGAAGTTVSLGGNSLAVGDAASTTFSGEIGGTGGLLKTGAGTLALSGTNSFQGGAIISAGTLVAASSSALGTGTATVASGARLRLDPGSIIANPIANLGSGSFLGTLDFAGGGLARTSSAGGTTLGTLLAGSAGSAASLNPAISWLAQTSATSSDIMRLTNTSGTAQVLSLTYDPLLAPASPQEAYLGWFDTGPSNTWVNAIDGNVGGTGSFFQGSWTAYLSANPGATPTSALGTYGHDSATNSVWAVVNHNSDFAVIVVPEPGTLALAGLGLAGLAALLRRRRGTPAI